MEPLRKVKDSTHFREIRDVNGQIRWEPCAMSARGASPKDLSYFMGKAIS